MLWSGIFLESLWVSLLQNERLPDENAFKQLGMGGNGCLVPKPPMRSLAIVIVSLTWVLPVELFGIRINTIGKYQESLVAKSIVNLVRIIKASFLI